MRQLLRLRSAEPVRRRCPAWLFAVLLSAVSLAGCQPDRADYDEVKRLQEKVADEELDRYLQVVRALPSKTVPDIPVYRPLPDWNPERTLPVSELVKNERKLLNRGWDVNWLSGQLEHHSALRRALRQQGMSLEQFVGLTLTIGAALNRSQIREDQDLDAIYLRGRATVEDLLQDDRPFAKLSREAQFPILRQAGWITRMDRASRMMKVPPENVALVKAHRTTLEPIFPPAFLKNPLDDIADLLEERGMPFEELDSSGHDAEISWTPENAIIGEDEPDAERTRGGGTP